MICAKHIFIHIYIKTFDYVPYEFAWVQHFPAIHLENWTTEEIIKPNKNIY